MDVLIIMDMEWYKCVDIDKHIEIDIWYMANQTCAFTIWTFGINELVSSSLQS